MLNKRIKNMYQLSLKKVEKEAKKILELNKDKILNIETNDQNVTRDFNTRDNFSS